MLNFNVSSDRFQTAIMLKQSELMVFRWFRGMGRELIISLKFG